MEVEQGDGSCAESMFRELIDDRTPVEMLSAINDLIQDQEDGSGDQYVQADARESTRLQKLIIRPGHSKMDLDARVDRERPTDNPVTQVLFIMQIVNHNILSFQAV